MCGFAGFQGSFDRGLLPAMNSALAHRGPDAEGCSYFPAAGAGAATGFAHRRLSIIDLSDEGRQPMTVHCPRCRSAGLADLAMVYNGEVYNFPSLRAELVSRGHVFHSETDSEVLIHLYGEQGPEMLSRLDGIFAFALRDGRREGLPAGMVPGDVLLARDGLGVKPLYYGQVEEGLVFASEIKALLEHEGISRELDPVSLHHTLAYLWSPAPRTALAAVRKLPPGFALLLRDGAVAREWCHYDLPYGRPYLTGSFDDVAAQVRDEVAAAVERQMVSDVPVGAFLSGGMDSSAVVAMMKRARPDYAPRCYTIGFRGKAAVEGAPSDLPYAQRVAAHLGLPLEVLEVGPDMIEELERMLWHLDEPQPDPAPINALLISDRARRDGIKVLLSGAGGDDLFTGYRRHYALQMERWWAWLPGSARAWLATAAASGRRGGGGMPPPWLRRLEKAFAHAHLPPSERMVAYWWWSGEETRRALYAPALRARLADEQTAEPLLRSLERVPAGLHPLDRMLYLEAKHFLADHNLNYTDKMGMAAGVEVRVPLLDPSVVDLATRIPPSMKQRGRVGKAVFKRAFEGILPHDVIYREKTGFGAPLRSWLNNELRGRVDETLSPASLEKRGLFDPAAVRRLVEADRAGAVDGAYTIFGLMCIELWCRLFADRKPARLAASVAGMEVVQRAG